MSMKIKATEIILSVAMILSYWFHLYYMYYLLLSYDSATETTYWAIGLGYIAGYMSLYPVLCLIMYHRYMIRKYSGALYAILAHLALTTLMLLYVVAHTRTYGDLIK